MICCRKKHNVGILDEVFAITITQRRHILEVAGNRQAELFRDRQQLPRPVGNVEVRQFRLAQQPPADGVIGPQGHVTLAIVEVLTAAVAIHEVDTAAGARRIDEQTARVDAVVREFFTNKAAAEIVADVADESRAFAELRVTTARIAAGLPHVIEVLGEVRLAAEIDVGAVEVHVRIDAHIADHHRVKSAHLFHLVCIVAQAAIRCRARTAAQRIIYRLSAPW